MGSPGRGAETAPEHEAETSRRVAVAGDVTMDWNLARTRKLLDGGTAWNAEDRTETYGGPGGAAVLARLVEEVGATLADEGLTVQVAGPPVPQGPLSPGDPRFHHSFAVWSQYPCRKGDRDRSVWRVAEFLGLDRARTPQAAEEAGAAVVGPAEAGLVNVDDANLGFRENPALWPRSLHLTADSRAKGNAAPPSGATSPWVVLKMARPVATGDLWRELLRRHAARLIVVLTLNDVVGPTEAGPDRTGPRLTAFDIRAA